MSNVYNEILSGLTTTSYPLEDILLKLKVLAHKLKNRELATFVDSELNGYENEVPTYRIYKGTLMGTIENRAYKRTQVTLATLHLKKHGLENLTQCEFPEKISELIELAKQEEFYKTIPPELYQILSEPIGNGYVVTNAYVPIGKSFIVGILSIIRSKLLDLMFEMEDKFNSAELENLFENPTKEQQDTINPVINKFIQNIFNSYDGSTQNTRIELGNDK